ncbi:SDR family oxidoreductase [Nocardiopsis alborubida]|uniref:NmrA family transcriptional regulator n=1 Tax=Nocardiopsis alborubida TaxID=146802 RepID=A0A7X6MC23_9ACTN|nr:NAD-dependent epimerase/dehydratase family protein [Nocardiopsis alborubida]NKY96960.1 NmrA family transcriptional regulator [Nocardiopsis alborubida]
MTTEHVLVTGGTGMTGRRVTRLLRERGTDVRVGSRSGEPRFDWHEPATWDAVLEGATSVYLCYHPDLAFPGASETVAAFASRAARNGVRRAVLLSGRGEEGAERAEHAVRAVFPGLTVLRCSVFAQDFSESFLLGPVLEGTVALPVPDVSEPFVDLDDVAEIAARALTEDGHGGELYELTGPRSLTFTEATRLIGEAAGYPVACRCVPPQDFVAGAVAAGLPAEVAHGLTELFGEILDGRNAEPADGVEKALGRPAADFTGYVRRAGASGVWRR